MKKFYATLFSLMILFLAISPSLKLMLEDNFNITVEINIEEESKDKKTKVVEFDLGRSALLTSKLFDFKDNSINNFCILHYNSHPKELHSPPPELNLS